MKLWLEKTAVKTLKTMAQTAISVISTSAVMSDVDWKICASATVLSGILCVLMNISNIKEK